MGPRRRRLQWNPGDEQMERQARLRGLDSERSGISADTFKQDGRVSFWLDP